MKTIIDTAGVQDDTYLYVSKTRMYIKIMVGVFFIAATLYVYFNKAAGTTIDLRKGKLILYAGPAFGLLFFYQAYKGLKDSKPQLILNNNGIGFYEKPLMLWEDISDIKITWGSEKTLRFQYNSEKIKINFASFNIKPFELQGLIDTYRARHAKPGTQHEV